MSSLVLESARQELDGAAVKGEQKVEFATFHQDPRAGCENKSLRDKGAGP